MTRILVDADACPVKDEIERVADRHDLEVLLVTDGGLRPSRNPRVKLIIVEQGLDAADNWIAAHIGPSEICVTNDIPLAAACVARSAVVLRPNGDKLTEKNIGMALATRNLMQDLRDTGDVSGGPGAFSKSDRSNFLSQLETAVQQMLRS